MDPARLAPLLIAVIGSLLGLVFLGLGWLRGRMISGWTRTDGIVVTRQGDVTGSRAIYPTFRWLDQHGEEHQRTSSVRASLGPAPGQQVRVLFDPETPSRAVIDSTVQTGKIFVIIGALILAIAVIAPVMFLIAFAAIT